ncbi:hypothetical protein [Jatrophihabitans sp.]|jgi:hypothetical protein|uniref:hypothetical protein n=1 Tax=Jatrophihabitans sp. TaxID=1932789 RepID=UPI002F053DFB
MAKLQQHRADAVRPGQIVNEQPRPRVLVTGFGHEVAEAIGIVVAEVAPTVSVELYLPNVDLSEYDCVITGDKYFRVDRDTHPRDEEYRGHYTDPPTWWKWRQEFPPHVSIFRILDGSRKLYPIADMRPCEGEGESFGHEFVYLKDHVPGRYVRYAQGLPDEISELVKRYLAPAAQDRADHITISVCNPKQAEDEPAAPSERDSFELRPLLYGPSDEILAGTYQRSAEASVWLLPSDLIGDLRAWLVAAFREWHQLYPKRFPAVADWTRAADWATPTEADLMRQIRDADEALEKARAEHEETVAALEEVLSGARADSDAYERGLLTATGTPLEVAVLGALAELGFVVRNMDDVWAADARREDFRITDPDEPGWLAIGEAKGFIKGVSESGLMNLMKYTTMYASEEKQAPQRQWYLANYFLREDPATRPQALNGRDDVIAAFAGAGGLLIDTRDLFALLLDARQHPERRSEIRALVRAQTGRLARPADPDAAES